MPRRALTPIEVVILVAMIAALALSLVAPMRRSARLVSEARTDTFRVEVGDTLWDIARRHPIPGLSTAKTVAFIRGANGLDSSDLAPGAVLIVPASATAAHNVAQR